MLGILTNYTEQDPQREYVRRYVSDVAAGGPGGTYGPAVGRWVVGGFRTAFVLPAGADSHQRLRTVLDYVARNAGSGETLGYWKDDRGRYWLDVVKATDSAVVALTWAHDNGELAVYDRQNAEVVEVLLFADFVGDAWAS